MSGSCRIVRKATRPTISLPPTETGQGVPAVNIALQTFLFWHSKDTAATDMPSSFRVFAFFLRLHCSS